MFPKNILSTSLFFLILTVPSVQIVGDREVHVKAGTSVTLKCLISNCLEEPAYVFWYHGERRLLDDDDQIPGKENQIFISVWLRIFAILLKLGLIQVI